jgi:hypothetical protein
MKLNLLKSCFAFLITGIMFISCEEKYPELVAPDQDINSITVKDGRLVFKNPEELIKTMEKLGTMDEENLNTWLNQLEGFKSSSTLENIEDHNLPTFLSIISNQNFLYQVGEDVIYLFKDSLYIIEESKKEVDKVLALAAQGKSIENVEGVTVYSLERKEIPIKVGNEKSNGENLWVDAKYQKTCDYGGRRRKWVFYAATYRPYYDYWVVEIGINLESMYTSWGKNYYRPWEAKSFKEMRNVKIINHYNPYSSKYVDKLSAEDTRSLFTTYMTGCIDISIEVEHFFAILTHNPDIPSGFSFINNTYDVDHGAYYYHVKNASWAKRNVCK